MMTAATLERRARIAAHRDSIDNVLRRYGLSEPRLFGSTARGEARRDSDIDLLTNLTDAPGSVLLRVAGASEELREILGVKVDVVVPELLREGVSERALAEAVPL